MTPSTEKSWLQRNWLWLTSGGCLTVLCVCVVFAGAIFFTVTGAIRSSDVYQQALEKARANPAVVEALGEPIEPGWMPSGSINVSGPTGTANLAIPISGPKNSGTLYIEATKTAGTWEFSTLEVAVKGDERIDLLPQ